MNALEKNNRCIAWFNLQEFIRRGEREKALQIYRLLSISLQDQAFSHQLLGDILYTLNEQNEATKHYFKAAKIYLDKNKKWAALDVKKTIEAYESLLEENQKYAELIIHLEETL